MADLNYRPMGLETDVSNPNFAGATNPDSFLHAEFYWHEPFDRNKSDEESEKAGKMVRVKGPRQVYIRIMKPGDQTSILETPVREDHKRRFPEKWLYFQMQEGLLENTANQAGWKVENWEELTPDEIHKLKYHRFYTVEQIAGAQDAQVQKLGIGGPGLRERARVALRERMRKEFATDLNEKEAEIRSLRENQAKMQEQLNQLLEAATKPGAKK